MRSKIAGLAVALLLLPCVRVHADVTLTTYQRSGGFKGLGANEGQSQEQVQGTKSRSDRSIKYESALMRMAAGGDRTTIIRVDLNKIWELNLKKKTYTERAISVPPTKNPGAEKTEPSAPGKPAKEEKPTHRIKRTEFDVKKTGDKKDINGFKTERYLATALVEVEEIATKEVTSFLLDANVWTTPWTKALRQAGDEQLAFSKGYLQKAGFSVSPDKDKVFDGTSVAMLLGVGDAKTKETLEGLSKKMATIDGYAIATETIWTVNEDPKAVAREEQQKADAKRQEADESSHIDTSGGAKSIAEGLLGNFAKKKMKERQDKVDARRAAAPLLSTYYEVKSVNSGAIETSRFEIPAGFKKLSK